MRTESAKNPKGIELRSAVESDVAAIGALVASAYEHYIDRMGKPPGPMLDDYAQVVRAHRVRVAIHGDEIVGVSVLIDQPDGILLDNVAVSPKHQGYGIGKQLIAAAEKESRALGHDSIDLYTHELMSENIAMYARIGYREVARREVNGYRRVYMRKDLTA